MSAHSLLSHLVILLLILSNSVFSAPPNHDSAREAGDIQGRIIFCGQPLSDALIYSPGTSFDARSNVLGEFKISYMPQGTYDLVVKKNGNTLGTINQIVVSKKQTIDIGSHSFCSDLDGDGFSPPQDCDDSNPNINPSIAEACGDGIDNNCDGQVDEQCTTCTDNDTDGFFAQSACGSAVDCDDSNPTINPLAEEVCDSLDNDCDGIVDEEGGIGAPNWYSDIDGDNYGDLSNTINSCGQPQGYTLSAGDCDDSDPSIHPGALEYCDGLDNNCDGQVDEASPSSGQTWYTDADGDGYGELNNLSILACYQPDGGLVCPSCVYVLSADDCDDTHHDIYPGATESCDGFDNDCDGQIDEFCL